MAANFQNYILQTGTALHQTDETFAFALADWDGDSRPDLFIVKKSNTGTGGTEVSILSGASSFQNFLLQTGTALHQTDHIFDFAVVDWNNDGWPDLFIIKKSNTGTGSTEVSILSGASNFQDYLLQTGTPLHQTDESFAFALADWTGDGKPDLFIIKKSNTGTDSTEISILSGASSFQEYLLQTGTVLHQTDHSFDFAVADWNNDGWPDLVIIKKNNTDTQ
ncbi:VCBS repeat-containing protein, partial [Methylovulum sp.]